LVLGSEKRLTEAHSSKRQLRTILRDATQAVHRETDAAMSSHADVTTVDGYSRFLATMNCTIAYFAASLDASAALASIDRRSAALAVALTHDLDALGAPMAQPPEPALPSSDALSAGIGYALEGSAVGGGFLMRRVTASLPSAPTAYLSALTTNRANRWAQYCEWLDRAGPSLDVDQAIQGAHGVFAFVQNELSNPAGDPYDNRHPERSAGFGSSRARSD